MVKKALKKWSFVILVVIIIFLLLQIYWNKVQDKKTNILYVTLCNERLQGNHRTGNHLFMLSALLDFAIKTQREIILPAKGWVLDKIFDFNQLNYPFGEPVFKISRYENRSTICPCERIQNPMYNYDDRFNQSQFLKIYSSQNVSASNVNVEICGLSQTSLHTLTPDVAYRLNFLAKILKDGAFNKALVIITLFKKMMLQNELSSFALYSYNGIEDKSISYISLKSYSVDESKFPNWLQFTSSAEEPFVVGVHVRMGDFLLPSELDYGLSVASGKYFQNSFKYFMKAYRKIVFVVLSDDVNWVTKHFPDYFRTKNSTSSTFNTTDIKIVLFRDSLPQDFAFLCRSDGLIISTGTFGWWAGWFNNRATVVYYDDYPRNNSRLGRLLDKKKYYIKRWLPML